MCVFKKQQDLQIFIHMWHKYMSYFHPNEVVDRVGEPQLQVGENFNYCRSGNFRVFKFSRISEFGTFQAV